MTLARCFALLLALAGSLVWLTGAEPDAFVTRLREANTLLEQRQLEPALGAAKAAGKLDTNRFEAPFLAAVIYLELKQPEPARLALNSALALAPAAKKAPIEELLRQLNAAEKPAVATANPALTGPARREWDVLRLIIDDADKAKLAEERKKFLREYLVKSEAFVQANPGHLPAWTLRAVAALELDEYRAGFTAGKAMEKLGAGDSDDDKTRRVLAMLVRKGWTGEERKAPTKDAPFENSLGMKFVPVPGTDVLFSVWETRVQDFEAFVRASGHDATAGMYSDKGGKFGQHGDSWQSPGFSQSSAHPVCGVSWDDAQAFCRWLSQKEGKTYRLPTDVEWSRAVGLENESGNTPMIKGDSGMKDAYPWGTQWPPPRSAGNYGSSLNTDSFDRTSPVGSFSANPSGLFDLGGNVWEWCEDYYDGNSGPRVLRGGAWYDFGSGSLQSSSRVLSQPEDRSIVIGFRVVLVVVSARKAGN